jgi:hypothetical protein
MLVELATCYRTSDNGFVDRAVPIRKVSTDRSDIDHFAIAIGMEGQLNVVDSARRTPVRKSLTGGWTEGWLHSVTSITPSFNASILGVVDVVEHQTGRSLMFCKAMRFVIDETRTRALRVFGEHEIASDIDRVACEARPPLLSWKKHLETLDRAIGPAKPRLATNRVTNCCEIPC